MKRGIGYLLMQAILICCLSSVAIAAERYEQVKSDIQAGRTEAALVDLRSMVQQQPGDYQAWFLLGVATARQQQYHQSIEAFRQVIELNASLAEPHNNLAVIYNELGDVRAAVGELEQSLKKRPGYAIAEENLADLYVKLALKNYRSALEKQPRPALEKRYARLLQVRDPDVAPDGGTQVAQVAVKNPVQTVIQAGSPQEENRAAEKKDVKEIVDVVGKAVVKEVEVKAPTEAEVETVKEGGQPAVESVQPQTQASKQSLVASESELSEERDVLERLVLAAVEKWRSAWASRDLNGYFSAYGADFEVPERFASAEEWRAYKQRVIESKTYIEIELIDFHIELDEKSARANVKFFQKFRSNSYNGDDLKVLKMKLDRGVWKIVKEDSVS